MSLQPKFLLQEGFMNIHTGGKEREVAYIADFKYIEGDRIVVEDVKGIKTSDYKKTDIDILLDCMQKEKI